MKRHSALFLFLLGAVLLGMGTRGDIESLKDIPIPEKRFKAEVTDTDGVKTLVDYFSWEGQVYFAGYRGKGVYTLSFEKVKSVEFGPKDKDNKVAARFYLKNGDIFEIKMDADKFFYGKTAIGNFRIQVGNTKYIQFVM